MRTIWNFSPLSERLPLPPLPFTRIRSTASGRPLSVIEPLTWTDDASSAAFCASATTCSGVFFASPFDELPPQPASASSNTAPTSKRLPMRREHCICGGSIAPVEARSIHHVGVAVEDLDSAVRTYERLFGGRLEQRERVEEQGVE